MFRGVVIVLVAGVVSHCSPTELASPENRQPAGSQADPRIETIAREFKSLKLITPRPVEVNPELAMLCRGADEDDVKTARKKFGVHANAAVSIYMNAPAADAFARGGKAYPQGAVVVKEKHFEGYRAHDGRWVGGGDGVGGMVKRAPGFDPDHGDWEYFYFQDPGKIEHGRIASCVRCHAAAAASDHVFGTWAKPKNGKE